MDNNNKIRFREFRSVHSNYDILLCVSSLRCFAGENDDRNSRGLCCLGNWCGCTCIGVPCSLHYKNCGQIPVMCPVAVVSRDLEVYRFVLVVLRSLAELGRPGDDI